MTQLYIACFVLLALLATTVWFWRFERINIGPLLCTVIAVAAVAGRLTFVLGHLDAYAPAYWRVLDARDGGFVDVVAMFAAFATAAQGTHRATRLRKPLGIAVAGAACAWALATVLVPYLADVPMRAPAVQVRGLDGAAVDLARFQGEPLVINLWASWCPPCRREMPLLADAQRRHPGVRFVFVNQGEELAQVRRFLQAQRLALDNVVADRLGQVGSATGSSALPTTLFFNRQGELVDRHVGEIDAGTLALALARLEQPAAAPR